MLGAYVDWLKHSWGRGNLVLDYCLTTEMGSMIIILKFCLTFTVAFLASSIAYVLCEANDCDKGAEVFAALSGLFFAIVVLLLGITALVKIWF
jgi:hypothetical protein